MPLPRTTPRLNAIDPEKLALETTRAVLAHLQAQWFCLNPINVILETRQVDGRRVPVEEYLPSTQVYSSVRDLVRWAQKGEGDAEETMDLCLAVAGAVYPSPADGSRAAPEAVYGESDPGTEVGLAIVAAFAREKLANGRPVTLRELAALGSLSVVQVRGLVRSRKISARRGAGRGWAVAADEAHGWLRRRGVPGFGAVAVQPRTSAKAPGRAGERVQRKRRAGTRCG